VSADQSTEGCDKEEISNRRKTFGYKQGRQQTMPIQVCKLTKVKNGSKNFLRTDCFPTWVNGNRKLVPSRSTSSDGQ